MAYKADDLVIGSLSEQWSATNNPVAGTTCVATCPLTANAFSKQHLTTIAYSMTNLTAAALAGTLSVRSGTGTGGTVLSQLRVLVPVGQSVQFSHPLVIAGKQGQTVSADFGTPNASANQNITICGWQEMRA